MLLFITSITFIKPLQAQQENPFTIETIFQIEKLGSSFNFSPNGKYLAYTIQRPQSFAKAHNEPYLFGKNCSDIWVVSTNKLKPVNITRGFSDSTGFWNPVWSPNGDYLTMLSTRNTDNASLWIWEKQSKHLKMINQNVNSNSVLNWLSRDEFIFYTLPEGQKDIMRNVLKLTPKKSGESLSIVTQGKEETSSILESGFAEDLSLRPQKKLIVYNVKTGASHVLGKGGFQGISISSDKQLIAAFNASTIPPLSADRLLQRPYNIKFQIRLFNRNKELVSKTLSKVKTVVRKSIQWADDGNQFAFQGSTDVNSDITATGPVTRKKTKNLKGGPMDIFVYSIDKDQLKKISLPDHLSPVKMPKKMSHTKLKFKWSPDNRLMVYAKNKDASQNAEPKVHWWIQSKNGKWKNLTKKLDSPPRDLYTWADKKSVIGLSKGNIWKISLGNGKVENLTDTFDGRINALSFRNEDASFATINVNKNGKEELYTMNLPSAKWESILKPDESAKLVTFSSESGYGAFTMEDRNGSSLWLQAAGSKSIGKPLVKINDFLSKIAKGETKKIKYTSLEGDTLKAWLILPTNYEKGKTYPLVSWVYQGSVYSNREPTLSKLNFNSSLNLQLFASKGYAVLFPSMPGNMADYLRMQNGVIPAINKIIEMGIADPEKLVVMGQSGGGYTTYSFITQTNKFKTAISLAGMSNMVSYWGQLDTRARYLDYAQEDYFPMSYSETGGHGLAAIPWKNPQAYIKNSPFFYADRVETPVLIIQGDLDYVHIQQGEEFFNALYRQGKRTRFIRYWGEGHVIQSPANIKHMWKQIFKWLKENDCAPNQ